MLSASSSAPPFILQGKLRPLPLPQSPHPQVQAFFQTLMQTTPAPPRLVFPHALLTLSSLLSRPQPGQASAASAQSSSYHTDTLPKSFSISPSALSMKGLVRPCMVWTSLPLQLCLVLFSCSWGFFQILEHMCHSTLETLYLLVPKSYLTLAYPSNHSLSWTSG